MLSWPLMPKLNLALSLALTGTYMPSLIVNPLIRVGAEAPWRDEIQSCHDLFYNDAINMDISLRVM